jgi:hypothetical protein
MLARQRIRGHFDRRPPLPGELSPPGRVTRTSQSIETDPEAGPAMHNVFYIIGVVVVVLAILSLLGLA